MFWKSGKPGNLGKILTQLSMITKKKNIWCQLKFTGSYKKEFLAHTIKVWLKLGTALIDSQLAPLFTAISNMTVIRLQKQK